jgi:hypothetical protein
MNEKELDRICDILSERFLDSDKYIHSIGIGISDKKKDFSCINIGTEKKDDKLLADLNKEFSRAEIQMDECPRAIIISDLPPIRSQNKKRIDTNVCACGKSINSCLLNQPKIIGGVRIIIGSDYGTLGYFAQKNSNPQKKFIISNNHVLTRMNTASIWTFVDVELNGGSQVSSSGVNPPPNSICKELDFSVGYKKSKNIDIAISAINQFAQLNLGIEDIGKISGFGNVSKEVKVRKYGSGSCLTNGQVIVKGIRARIKFGSNWAKFNNLIKVKSYENKPFVVSGDSGSLLVDDYETPAKAVGLLFAGSNSSNNSNGTGTNLSSSNTNYALAHPISVIITWLQENGIDIIV